MIWQSVTVPPPHRTNRYAGPPPSVGGRSRQPSAQDAWYALLIRSKKSQYSCSLPARACAGGPAASASRTESAHFLLKKSGVLTAQPPARTGLIRCSRSSISGGMSMPTSFSLRRSCWKNSSRTSSSVQPSGS